MATQVINIGRRKIVIAHDNFEYYQPNDHICGDCAVRAISKAIQADWYKVYDDLVSIGRKQQRMPNEREVVDEYLKSKGFIWVPISVKGGNKRPTTAKFAEMHKEPAVLSLANHYTSSKDGKYYDIWDCGRSALYGYWIKLN